MFVFGADINTAESATILTSIKRQSIRPLALLALGRDTADEA
jgi:hypothetical protein